MSASVAVAVYVVVAVAFFGFCAGVVGEKTLERRGALLLGLAILWPIGLPLLASVAVGMYFSGRGES